MVFSLSNGAVRFLHRFGFRLRVPKAKLRSHFDRGHAGPGPNSDDVLRKHLDRRSRFGRRFDFTHLSDAYERSAKREDTVRIGKPAADAKHLDSLERLPAAISFRVGHATLQVEGGEGVCALAPDHLI